MSGCAGDGGLSQTQVLSLFVLPIEKYLRNQRPSGTNQLGTLIPLIIANHHSIFPDRGLPSFPLETHQYFLEPQRSCIIYSSMI